MLADISLLTPYELVSNFCCTHTASNYFNRVITSYSLNGVGPETTYDSEEFDDIINRLVNTELLESYNRVSKELLEELQNG